jgi:hypothetical protein
MARYREPSEVEERMWRAWCASRPPDIEEAALRFEPWSVYRRKSIGHIVVVTCITEHEEGRPTVMVRVAGEFNKTRGEHTVQGVQLDDLEPCEVPDPKTCAGGGIFNDLPFDA